MTDHIDIISVDGSARHRAQKRFKSYGLLAIGLSLTFLFIMVGSIVLRGSSAFKQSFVQIKIELSADAIDADNIKRVRFGKLLKQSLRNKFPEATSRKDKKQLYKLVSPTAEYSVRKQVEANPTLIGTSAKLWVRTSSDVDMYLKGYVDANLDESKRRLSDLQLEWISLLQRENKIESRFNTKFFTGGDSREPEQAGVLGAVIGSALSLLVCFMLSFPLGVLAAVYLEEFAPKNRLSRIIEVNINNLAAVPSIVFGLLGLAIFLNFFGLPRSTPMVGGMVLALMTLPTIIIASRTSVRAVPSSIREAAMGIGANKVQTTFHHVVPLAMPGMLTGSIIGMAQALGETAPLLMIGMVAFIVDVPQGITDAATALPVQIFLWADSPERGFLEKTSAAIMVLLAFLIVMNLVAIILRRRFEQRW
ncbi:MAG: phosphate ABC transporter permease PstA [Hyphomicrobiales bacterium]|nr:phosphate ABC transporter permease PstA [Hyphomicrobiales bacterium]